jgi:hypothetical protein
VFRGVSLILIEPEECMVLYLQGQLYLHPPLLACGLRLSDSAVEDGRVLVLGLVFSPAEVAGTTETGVTYFMCSGLLPATISKGGLWLRCCQRYYSLCSSLLHRFVEGGGGAGKMVMVRGCCAAGFQG